MKKFVSAQLIVGMLLVGTVAASAAVSDPPKVDPNQAKGGAQSHVIGANGQDKRIITPDMNARERVETQRAYQKRAAAKRNELMQKAERERMQQAGNEAKPGKSGAQ